MTIRLVTKNGTFVSGIKPGEYISRDAKASPGEEVDPSWLDCAKAPDEMPMLVSIQRAMHELGLGKTKVFDLMKKGTLERVRIDGRSLVSWKSIKKLAGEE